MDLPFRETKRLSTLQTCIEQIGNLRVAAGRASDRPGTRTEPKGKRARPMLIESPTVAFAR